MNGGTTTAVSPYYVFPFGENFLEGFSFGLAGIGPPISGIELLVEQGFQGRRARRGFAQLFDARLQYIVTTDQRKTRQPAATQMPEAAADVLVVVTEPYERRAAAPIAAG